MGGWLGVALELFLLALQLIVGPVGAAAAAGARGCGWILVEGRGGGRVLVRGGDDVGKLDADDDGEDQYPYKSRQ